MEKLTEREIESLILLSKKELPSYLNYSKLAKIMNFNVSDSRFIKIKNILNEKKIIKEVEKIGSSIIISIDKNKLDFDVIFEIPLIKFYEQNFRKRYKMGVVYS